MIEKYVEIDTHIRDQFNYLYELVIQSPVNVTSIKDKGEFASKHILDSLYYFLKNPMDIKTVADIGSGGGFPGFAMAIYFPDWNVTLVDSIAKKCRFLEDTAAKLNLTNVKVINNRAEMIKNMKFDLITARGVGTVRDILKFTGHLTDKAWLMYKGEKLETELKDAKIEIDKRGLKSEIFRVEEPFTRSYLYMHY